MPPHLAQPWERSDNLQAWLHGCVREKLGERRGEHRIAFAGPIVYCTTRACFAQKRLGSRFKGDCALPAGRVVSAVAYRPARLRAGKHPIAGRVLRAGE